MSRRTFKLGLWSQITQNFTEGFKEAEDEAVKQKKQAKEDEVRVSSSPHYLPMLT